MNTFFKELYYLKKEITNTLKPLVESKSILEMREIIYPVMEESQFFEKGILTPEEFVKSGDKMISMSDKVEWRNSYCSYTKTYLPRNKQFLFMKNLKCSQIVQKINKIIDDEQTIEMTDEDGIVICDEKINENIHDDFVDEKCALDELTINNNDSVIEKTYNVSITYDKYWQVPRIWISGQRTNGKYLTHEEIFEDICNDYTNKTVTIENHPFFMYPHVSIHPCGHSNMMLNIIENIRNNGGEPSIDDYVSLFMIIMQNIIPIIDFSK